jgi:hypothetical protein
MIARGCGYTIVTRPSKEEQGLRCWQSTCRRNRKDSHFEGLPSCHPFLTFTGYLFSLTTSAFPWSCHSLFFILLYPQHPSCSVSILKHFFSPLILDSWVHHLFTFLYNSCLYPSGSYHFFYPPSKYLSHLFVSILLCSTNFLFKHILFIPQIFLLSSS